MSDLIVKLTDVCDFQGGSQPPKEGWITKPEDGYIRMLQIRDFTQNRASQEEYVKITNSTKTCKSDDILIARYGASLGKIVTGLAGAYNVALMKTIPDENLLTKRYLYYFLLSEHFQNKILSLGSRAAQAGFNKAELDDIYIYLPDNVLQFKITSILDKAKELIDKRKEQIEACDELIKGLFYHKFGDIESNDRAWDMKPFGYFSKIDTKMTKDFSRFADLFHIGIDNIEKETGRLVNLKKVKESGLTSGKYIFNSNHIIYSKIRPNLNKVALPNFDGLCSADAYPLLVDTTHTNREFFGYILRSTAFLNYILRLSSRTNIPKVNKDQLQGFCTIAPPFDLQNRFAEQVKKIEQQKQLLQQSLTELENNFNALMQRAFKGELL
ncbi:restriction endonuclease subunit S [Paenibacillus sp.]|uniref:restriction endonuclease subunit S n=1 Tax=Paenibacillus TaxID=44249 RepID=UPI003565CB60